MPADQIDKLTSEYNSLKLEIGLMTQRVTEMAKRFDEMSLNVRHHQGNTDLTSLGVEKLIGDTKALRERVEKLESNQTWFVRGITGLVIAALGVLLFKGGVKPI